MKMSMTWQMRMTQQMKLAPRMIQSMEILQLPALALLEKIETELNSNPVLEMAESQDESDQPVESPQETATDSERELVVGQDNNKTDDFERLDEISEDFGEYMYRGGSIGARRYDPDRDQKLEALNNTAALSQSLHEYLMDQWRLVDVELPVKKAGELIIDYIDDKGYLKVRLEQLHNQDKHDFSVDDLKTALKLVQQLEPVGVGARDVKECMLIQMAQSPDDMSFEIRMISEHMDKLLENQLPQIAKKMNCSLDDLNEAIRRMRKLDTSPGANISQQPNYAIKADVIVDPSEEGGYLVYLADMSVRDLQVNRFYSDMAKDRKLDDKTRDFLRNNIRSAQWLMEAIEQRKRTLLRVSRAVVKRQIEFFDKGLLYLKPLPMSKIAEDVGVHVATVSRAVAGKYIQSPQGLHPLRSFFGGGMETVDGANRSFESIRVKLQEFIDAEDKSKPLSDDSIRKKLEAMGIKNIARRTIAKYRKLLNIPTARFRKKF